MPVPYEDDDGPIDYEAVKAWRLVPNDAVRAIWDQVITDGEWEKYPDPDCAKCSATGWIEIIDWVDAPFGKGLVPMPSIEACECTWKPEVDPTVLSSGMSTR